MKEQPQEKGKIRRSLGARIALSYSAFVLKSFAAQFIVLTAVFWLCAGWNAAEIAKEAARKHAAAGTTLVIERTEVEQTQEDLKDRPFWAWSEEGPVMTLDVPAGNGRARVAYSMRGEMNMYRTIMVAWGILELVRICVLLRGGERISRRALRPITEIAGTARRLSASNLSERIELHGARNELLELSGVLNDMLDRIEAAYNTQKQFVSDASHELRTPIAVIQGYADMLDRWGKSDPEVMNEAIAAIRSEAAGMKELIEQLLFIARHDSGRGQYQMIYFDASDLVDEIFRDTRVIARKHQIKYGEMQRAIVMGDRASLKQALRIFVDNAVKYTPEGGMITLSCRKEEKFCRMTVSDTGVGVAESELERIFERFYRADEARSDRADGHGLGLSIARMIVRVHGGKIEVQSKKGVGSRFHILLPL